MLNSLFSLFLKCCKFLHRGWAGIWSLGLISFVNAWMYHTISLLQYIVVSKYRVTVTVKAKEKIKLWLPWAHRESERTILNFINVHTYTTDCYWHLSSLWYLVNYPLIKIIYAEAIKYCIHKYCNTIFLLTWAFFPIDFKKSIDKMLHICCSFGFLKFETSLNVFGSFRLASSLTVCDAIFCSHLHMQLPKAQRIMVIRK